MPFDPLTLGNNIAARREELGLSQRELGLRCGVTQVAVHHWEAGLNPPTLFRLGLLADALGISAAQLLADTETNGHDDDQAVA